RMAVHREAARQHRFGTRVSHLLGCAACLGDFQRSSPRPDSWQTGKQSMPHLRMRPSRHTRPLSRVRDGGGGEIEIKKEESRSISMTILRERFFAADV